MKKIICLVLTVLMIPFTALFSEVSALSSTASELTENWGVKQTRTASDGNTYTYWQNVDGTTSALISDDNVTWLYIEYIDHFDSAGNPVYVYSWLGIKNSLRMDGTLLFEKGSRFYVRVLQPNSDDWLEIWNKMDADRRSRLDPDTLRLLKIGVTAPDGTEYNDLGDLTELFVQYSSAFDVFFDDNIFEENIAHIDKMLPINGIPAPESGRYAVFLLTHLGEDFVLDSYGNAFNVSSAGSMISDGTSSLVPVLCIASGVAGIVIGAVAASAINKKKKKNAFADGTANETEDNN